MGQPECTSEEACENSVGQVRQVHESQKIDGLEFAVDGWRPADAARDVQIGAEEPWWARGLDGHSVGLAGIAGLRQRAQSGLHKVTVLQRVVHRHAEVLVLR